jgi:transcriptional regulator with XRE-family HTH domain
MADRTQIREFLTTRRARITPEQAGLPVYGGSRRVAGLRREEVALLAGVSVDYYSKLERGNLAGVSESVLDALSRALQLTEAERDHLYDLARSANTRGVPASSRRRPSARRVRPGLQLVLDSITEAPADLRNGRRDVLASNRLGRALYSEMYADPVRPVNVARFTFLSPRSRDFFRDWDQAATDIVASLRTEAGRNPYDKGLSDLIGELSTRSEEFRTRWAAHNVRQHTSGTKRLHHPIAGDLDLGFEAMQLPSDTGLTVVIYTAQPGTPTAAALQFLASWSDTQHTEEIGGPAVARTTDS